jgi:hypothetical protein
LKLFFVVFMGRDCERHMGTTAAAFSSRAARVVVEDDSAAAAASTSSRNGRDDVLAILPPALNSLDKDVSHPLKDDLKLPRLLSMNDDGLAGGTAPPLLLAEGADVVVGTAPCLLLVLVLLLEEEPSG